MSYDVSAYTSDEQAAILALIAHSYGVPSSLITDYVPGNFVTAALFNKRNAEIDALLAYLEDSRRDETARALVAETVLNNRISAIVGGGGGASFISQDTASPVSGTHALGDVVFNANPAAGQPIGWMCTVGGTPGTWVVLGYLYKSRTVTTSTTLDDSDSTVQVNATAALNITLPDNNFGSGKSLVVKDVAGNASTFTISFLAGSGTTLGEPTSIDSNYGSRTLYLDGTVWRIQ